MKRRDALLVLCATAAVIFALLAVFAIELADTQAKDKRDVESRVHERAVMASALISSVFQAASAPATQARQFGGRVVTRAQLDAAKGGSDFTALYSGAGRLLATSSGFGADASASIRRSGALVLVQRGAGYGLGNLEPDGGGSTVPWAVGFSTAYGKRMLVSGIPPTTLSNFLIGELDKIPGVRGSHNSLIDGNLTVIASTAPDRPAGYVVHGRAVRRALSLAGCCCRGQTGCQRA